MKPTENGNAHGGVPRKQVLLDTALVDVNEMQFPFRDSVMPGESGQGYALRMAEENGLGGLPQLKKWLGKSRFAVLDAVDAPMLSRWFGADERSLWFALGQLASGGSNAEYLYAGQQIGRSYFLNRSYPRLCPACIQEDGCCLIAWDISLVTACAKHRTTLTERCPHCLHAISWNRPGLLVCSCGFGWQMAALQEKAAAVEIEFAAWVSDRICSKSMTDESVRIPMDAHGKVSPLTRLLQPLSLDGGLHIVYALGTAASYDEQIQRESPRQRAPLNKARQLLKMAAVLADKMARLEPVRLRVQHPSVVVQLLAESASAQADPADRSLAYSILSAILHQKAKTTWAGRNPQLSQLALF